VPVPVAWAAVVARDLAAAVLTAAALLPAREVQRSRSAARRWWAGGALLAGYVWFLRRSLRSERRRG
jgi:hypothetical protein